MTGDVGLPYAQRQVIAAMLGKALTALGRQPSAEHAADVTIGLLAAVDEYGRAAGLFELAAAAVIVIGGPPTIPGVSPMGPMRYLGYGRDPRDAQPQTPLQHLVSQFGTAILAHDRPAAWNLFAPLAPADDGAVRQDCADMLAMLVRNAWARHRGGDLHLSIQSGNQWPPVCDFCCHDVAAWMWRCRDGDVRVRRGSGPAVTLRLDDMEFWYGCDTCRPMVATAHPNWGRVFTRQHSLRPDAHRSAVMPMFEAFELARLGVQPEPLPETRPTPTPGRT